MLRFWVAVGLTYAFVQIAGCGGDSFTSEAPHTEGSGGEPDASPTGGASGSGGASGAAGSGASGASGGSSGRGGTGGLSGRGGASGNAGSGGRGGSAGTAGSAGTGGTVGSTGAGGSGGTAGTAGGAGTAGTGGAGCGSDRPGPTMVEVTSASGTYCIDSTEVTNAQYAAFLATNPGTSGQPAHCAWNTSYTPSNGWPVSTDQGRHPVAFVDWCDAAAFCQWAGKRLCGKIGEGANAPADLANAAKSQWFNACSAGGTRVYPYGNTYAGSTCNGDDTGKQAPVPVGSMTGCQGGIAGIYDLSGNVWEWEDSCSANTGANDTCQTRGGAYLSTAQPLRCDFDQKFYRNATLVTGAYVGFRCCAP